MNDDNSDCTVYNVFDQIIMQSERSRSFALHYFFANARYANLCPDTKATSAAEYSLNIFTYKTLRSFYVNS